MADDVPREDRLALDQLFLDDENPRLPPEIQGSDEATLRTFMAETYNAIEVGRSIALHGYFTSEPLICIPEADRFRVVEGNRRLVALQLLSKPVLSEGLDDQDEWKKLSESASLPASYPVVIEVSREAVAPVIGFRHISGIEPWEPYAKARFITQLVERGMEFAEVGSIVGEPSSNIAAQYRNHEIVRQATEDFAVPTDWAHKRQFGVFTRSMNSVALREFIGAPANANVKRGVKQMPAAAEPNVRELFSWLFGDEDNDKVIGESRDIDQLATVVASDDGLAVLRDTGDLEASYIAAGGLRERLIRRLLNARGNLQGAGEDIYSFRDDEEVQGLISECRDALEQLASDA